ncbi:MAG: hypothetical protein AAGI46_10100 [Planctomycetota bacterium]
MMRSLLTLVLVAVSLIASSAAAELPKPLQAAPVIEARDISQLREHLGQEVVVTGRVAEAKWSDSGKVMHVRFEGVAAKDFGLASFESTRGQFDRGFGGDIASVLTGSTVRIKGTIQPYGGRWEEHKDRVEILLRWPNQLTILELGSR